MLDERKIDAARTAIAMALHAASRTGCDGCVEQLLARPADPAFAHAVAHQLAHMYATQLECEYGRAGAEQRLGLVATCMAAWGAR